MLTPGDRTFATYCKPTAITDELLERVYTMSKGAKLVQMQEGFLPVYRKLHEEGTILIFDMGWDDELSFEKYGDYLRLADYYTPNTKEALKLITGRDTPGGGAAAYWLSILSIRWSSWIRTAVSFSRTAGRVCCAIFRNSPVRIPLVPGERSLQD